MCNVENVGRAAVDFRIVSTRNVGISVGVGPAKAVQVGKMDAYKTQVGTRSLDPCRFIGATVTLQ